ncbi:DUF2140 family protein [Clostridium sp. LBM24168]
MTRKFKISLLVIVPLIIILSILISLITWNSSNIPDFSQPSEQLAAKIINMPANNGSITLSNEELNELIGLYPIDENKFGDLKVKAIYTEIFKDRFIIYLPSNYKGINVLLSISGKPYLENGRIVYEINDFKVGKLKLPKSIVTNIVKKYDVKRVSLKDNKIIIDTSLFSLKMRELKLSEGSVTIVFY